MLKTLAPADRVAFVIEGRKIVQIDLLADAERLGELDLAILGD